MMLTPPPALKVHEPYIRHESGESAFTRAFILIQALVCQNDSLLPALSQSPSQNPEIENRGHFYLVTLTLWKTKKQAGGWSDVDQVVLKEYKEL